MSTPAAIITRLDEKIYEIINDPNNIISYKMGGKTVSKSQAISELRALRETYTKIEAERPYEDIRKIAFDFDEFGADESEWVGDEA